MSSSTRRSRRQNAGNKMHAMVAEERAKIASGAAPASDEDEDADFLRQADQDDEVDTDFAETDSEEEQRAEAAMQATDLSLARDERRQQRKAARKRLAPARAASSNARPAKQRPKPQHAAEAVPVSNKPPAAVRMSSRASAVRKALESSALEHERAVLAEIKRSRGTPVQATKSAKQMLTQEQLLEEARVTEIENTQRLQVFQEMEAEEKMWQRRMAQRRPPLIIRPVAHFRSFVQVVGEEEKTADGLAEAPQRRVGTEYALDKLDARYPLDPWKQRRAVKPLKMCAVTGLPAKYLHPRAKVPYANARAYQVLEEMVRGEHAFFYDIGVWSSSAIADN
ncbi:hypothetical protein LPJ73_004912 [Coemansia sp. RSA 2703]|nr:hypothetical protein LPJ73_004912 [Coemansia sp. RSA 2703]KAJ2371271.1 hypothetical protein IW150_004669 [Coemansia sp. RSA 2607]